MSRDWCYDCGFFNCRNCYPMGNPHSKETMASQADIDEICAFMMEFSSKVKTDKIQKKQLDEIYFMLHSIIKAQK